MNEDSKPQELPPSGTTPSTPPAPAPAAPVAGVADPGAAAASATNLGPGSATPATATPAAPGAPRPIPPTPIDYAIGAPKKPFTLPRYTFLYIKMIVGLCVLLGMGYFALVALNPKARKWATQGNADGSGGPTPFNAVNQVLAIPARAIGKTKDVVAASDARTGLVNNVVAEEEKAQKGGREAKPLTDIFSKPAASGEPGKKAPGEAESDDQGISRERLLALAEKNAAAAAEEASRPAQARPVAVAAPPPPGPPEMKLGGGITITNVGGPGPTAASAQFMYWVAGLGVGGVSNSTPPRFLMNGKLVREGDEVNKALGVTFDRLDAAAKVIHFKDKGGAVVTRSY